MSERHAADARALAAALAAAGADGARVAVVSGSGLGALGACLRGAREIAFERLEGMPASGVAGHAGRFLAGRWEGVEVLVQEGRVHLYEGWRVGEVTRAVRAFGALGVEVLLLTNAAGGLHPGWSPGTLMRIRDHASLQGVATLARGARGPEQVWDRALGALIDGAARGSGVSLERGVYAGLPGPSYETPAEVRALAALGFDAVGMSTVAEACAGAAAGMRVAGVSCVTNPAAGLSPVPLRHEDVVRAAGAAAAELARLFAATLAALPGGRG